MPSPRELSQQTPAPGKKLECKSPRVEEDGADFVQQATSDNLKRQSPSEIVILTNKNPVKWMKYQ